MNAITSREKFSLSRHYPQGQMHVGKSRSLLDFNNIKILAVMSLFQQYVFILRLSLGKE
jgi:hypothetical protein